MQNSLSFSLLIAALLTILARSSARSTDRRRNHLHRHNLRHNGLNSVSRLQTLSPVNPIDESKKVHTTGISKQAMEESRQKAKPMSFSGAKVLEAKTDRKVNVKPSDLGLSTSKMEQINNDRQSMGLQKDRGECLRRDHRKPWSAASPEERKAWLAAIRCTYEIPGVYHDDNGYMSKSMAEDYGFVHNALNGYLHGGPAFFPCHRVFVLTWLYNLRKQCGYQGDSLYIDWDYYADEGTIESSTDLWTPDYLGTKSCPVEGPFFGDIAFDFIGTRNTSSTQYFHFNHKLCRKEHNLVWSDDSTFESHLYSDVIRELLQLTDYDDFRESLETKLHNAVHGFISHDMQPASSPFDAGPFFMLHLYTDCIYWAWQEKNGGENRLKYDGFHRGTSDLVSVSDKCPVLGLGVTWTVADVMDADQPPGCFTCDAFMRKFIDN